MDQQIPDWLALTFEVIAVCSLLAAAVKPLLGDPKPSDPRWKRVVFGVMALVDFAAANTEPIRQKIKRSIPPPPLGGSGMSMRPTTGSGGTVVGKKGGTTLLVFLLLAISPATQACASGPSLTAHARLASSSAEAITELELELREQMQAAEVAAVEAAPEWDRARVRAAMMERHAPLERAYRALAAAHAAYVDAVRRAARDDGGPPLEHWTAVLFAWNALGLEAHAVGMHVLAPPETP